MLVSLTVGKVDAGVTVLLTPDKRLIEFPSILLPPDISSGSIVDVTVARNVASEDEAERAFRALQDKIFNALGAAEPKAPNLRCRNATQTSVVLEWDPIDLATADLISLALYRNGQKAGNIPKPTAMHSTKISGLAVDTEYTFHLVLRTTAGTLASDKVVVRTHKMTDLSGITITTGILPPALRESLARSVDRIGAKLVDTVRIDTTHFVTTEGRGVQWEKANELNIPVVRPEWVEACERNGRILGVTKFYLDAVRVGMGPSAADMGGSPPMQHNRSVSSAFSHKELPPQPSPPVPQQQQQQQQQTTPPPTNGVRSPDVNKPTPPPPAEPEPEPAPEPELVPEQKQEEELQPVALEPSVEATTTEVPQEDDTGSEKGGDQSDIASEPEDKATQDDEPKVLDHAKEEQGLPVRPASPVEDAEESKEGEDEDKDKDDSLNPKGGKSSDGASFQDVAL
ncbi:hypothetical protein GE21DRAFT_174 [Neurospora crassa]|uniref:Chitin biosynthesis protein CHS5 n=1 Tax=Neurospora crassa (strain ATCC 24698 / 74-OR23-1A / CBS 708.71 / DSM 1257 / FGSC 987) TaxID=367110 RepID=Q7SF18_NEUCR|nr:chitin biosynthesis protein CHS5 [Neurospora crassa OR74A]EAA35386.1 chitin biosynthesis protein CHS5 [Neurospora crassa OR74A]KHE80757.1 hypothetical protein GE21DRAFT_174 [Neurospora crassa]|eukprot:XP_964622.1 chitin biosynthesis protein CHS5 [Neurospora crassa OR74A]